MLNRSLGGVGLLVVGCALLFVALSGLQGDEARPMETLAVPNVMFHLHSSTTKGVHPMTYEAIDRAQDAISLARDVQDSETKDKAQIESVNDQVEGSAEDMDASMKDSRVSLWKTIGQLRNTIKGYRDKLLKMKADMMASDNYIAAREDEVENSVSRSKVSGERLVSNMKAKMENVGVMTGPRGAQGSPGLDGNPGSLGPLGAVGEPGRAGGQGATGGAPEGWLSACVCFGSRERG
ncbi:hypothetical protein T484DRAFT_3175203 [Baffinella frigidus]|nr:hypothetical protein T484DRAFT_3175203 [Cryptophyta sp. CCMP2293]